MGRLPSAGVVWYRRNLSIPASSIGKSLFLDRDGAMSYSEVWQKPNRYLAVTIVRQNGTTVDT
jgi:beta-galactosidase